MQNAITETEMKLTARKKESEKLEASLMKAQDGLEIAKEKIQTTELNLQVAHCEMTEYQEK